MKHYVIYPTFDGWAVTNLTNYKAYVQDARKIMRFSKAQGFTSAADVVEYCGSYLGIPAESITAAPY